MTPSTSATPPACCFIQANVLDKAESGIGIVAPETQLPLVRLHRNDFGSFSSCVFIHTYKGRFFAFFSVTELTGRTCFWVGWKVRIGESNSQPFLLQSNRWGLSYEDLSNSSIDFECVKKCYPHPCERTVCYCSWGNNNRECRRSRCEAR